MSQAKVDKYKKENANRKEILAKEKRQKTITKACFSVIAVVLVAWIGISTADFVYESRPKDKIYVQTADIDKYLEDLYEDETETTESTEEKKQNQQMDSGLGCCPYFFIIQAFDSYIYGGIRRHSIWLKENI